MQKLKLLISAYACEPGKGSEPGVGWRWALETAALGHDVWVLTRSNNEPAIAHQLAVLGHPSNLHFLYYDLPPSLRWWKRGGLTVHLYYLLWQWGAYKFIRARLAQLVDEHCGRVVAAQDATQAVQGLADALAELAHNRALITALRAGARAKAQAYSWRRVVTQVWGENGLGCQLLNQNSTREQEDE